MTTTHALAVLIALSASDRLDDKRLAEAASDIAYACEQPPATAQEMAIDPFDCVEVVAVLWYMEARFNPNPQGMKHGCGAMQVNVVKRMRHVMPTCVQMRDTPRLSFLWGVRIFRRKLYVAKGRIQRALVWYNGAEHAESYGRRAYKLLRRLESLRWEGIR